MRSILPNEIGVLWGKSRQFVAIREIREKYTIIATLNAILPLTDTKFYDINKRKKEIYNEKDNLDNNNYCYWRFYYGIFAVI